MPFRKNRPPSFRNRRDAERALREIIDGGGVRDEYRIEEGPDGRCVIVVFDHRDGLIAGTIGV